MEFIYSVNLISIVERIVLFLRNMFEFFGHCQFLEICAVSDEVVLFHDDGFVLL